MRRRSVVLLAAAVLGACGAGDEPAPRAASAPATPATTQPNGPVSVEVERSRLFEQQRALGVTVRNDGDRPAVLDRVRFAAGRYGEVPAADRTVTVPAHGVASFPVPYGPARCGADDADHIVHLRVDGRRRTLRVPVSAQVERAHTRECGSEAARRAVQVRFADDWQVVADRRVRGTLEVRPRDGHEVDLIDVTTSIVFVTEVGSRTGLGVALRVRAARCDAHALIESKKTFTFVVSVTIDGRDPVQLEVAPEDGPARAALEQAIEGCLQAVP